MICPNPQNQWDAETFGRFLEDAIAEENCLPELANIPRDQLVKAYLQGWLMLHLPAGNA